MDFEGQKLAEQLGLWIVTAAAAIAFVLGWSLHSFGLLAKVQCTSQSCAVPVSLHGKGAACRCLEVAVSLPQHCASPTGLFSTGSRPSGCRL